VEGNIEVAADGGNEIFILFTLDSSEVVIQVAYDQFIKAEHAEQMEQYTRIDSARNSG
jgi:hypothetical protein